MLSSGGGSTHRPKDGDFIWDLSFNFGPTDFPDGSTGKGTLIQCRDFYGTLRVFTAIDGKTLRCTTSEQKAFCGRSMTSFPLNRNPFHTLSQQEELL